MDQKRPKKISKKFEQMCEIYRLFSYDEWNHYASFEDKDRLELFYAETFGDECSKKNGFAIGKKFMDITVSTWLEENRAGTLCMPELYRDKYPSWWLNKVLNRDGPYNNGCYDAAEENYKLRTKIMEAENERLMSEISRLKARLEISKLPWYKRILSTKASSCS